MAHASFSNTALTASGAYMFQNCYNLERFCWGNNHTVNNTYMFNCCYGLKEVVLSNKFTDVKTYQFSKCYGLEYLKLPSPIATVAANSFNGAINTILDFRDAVSVPTLSDVNAFSTSGKTAPIIVPDELYDTWIITTNWKSTSIVNRIIKVSDWEAAQI